MNHRPADAIPWFQRSANAFYPDAMCWLARAYLSGEGIELNLETGLHWIDTAARKGHPLGQALHALPAQPRRPGTPARPEPLPPSNQALDDIERQTLLKALEATADTP
ncbi:MAG: hypothetical protein MZV65_47710 [Chromatiales bacterium]|nr:hypothetical protein [Chromatiales bacterium]